MTDLVPAVAKVIEMKHVVGDVTANKRRCRTLCNRLVSLQPTIEVFRACADENEANKALARTICTLVDGIEKYVTKFRKYEGRGPTIKGQSVGAFAFMAFNRADDKEAFDRFNAEITQFSADVALVAHTKALDTSRWSEEDAQDEEIDNKEVLDAIADLRQTGADRHAEQAAAAAGFAQDAARQHAAQMAAAADLHQVVKQLIQTSFKNLSKLMDVYEFEPKRKKQALLGKGAFGVTYRMKGRTDGTLYAVKMVNIEDAQSVGIKLEDMQRETQTMQALNHTNVIRYWATCMYEREVEDEPSASTAW